MEEHTPPEETGKASKKTKKEKPKKTDKPVKRKKEIVTWILALLSVALVVTATFCLIGQAEQLLDNYLGRLNYHDDANDIPVSPSEEEQIILDDPEIETIDPEEEEEIPDISDIVLPTQPPAEPVPEEQPKEEPIANQDNVVNILLIGQDRRPGQGRQRSDSMILVTFNKAKSTVTLTSFMRDSYVQIPGYKPNKLNAAYAYGGMRLINETFLVNFGVEVDGNVEVDFNSFQKIIDLLDGVDIKLTQKEVDHLNRGTKWGLTKGVNHLTGEQALAYSRIRYIDSDYRRAERQRKVLLSLIDRYKTQSVGEMLDMLEEILPLITTNINQDRIIDYTLDLAPMLAGAKYDTLRIPADGTFRQGRVRIRAGLAAWLQYDIDFSANRALLNKLYEQ